MNSLAKYLSQSNAIFGVELRRENRSERAAIAIVAHQISVNAQVKRDYSFGEEERAYCRRQLAERRQSSFLRGREAARDALTFLGSKPCCQRGIGFGVFGQPVVYGDCGYAVSITHTDVSAVSVAYPLGHPLAVDLEALGRESLGVIQTVLTSEELQLVRKAVYANDADESLSTLVCWSAREALSKVLGCGFMCSAQLLSLSSLEVDSPRGWHGEFRHLGQWAFCAVSDGDQVLALVHPRRTTLIW